MSRSVGVSAKTVANKAKSQIGYHEGPNNHNKYAAYLGRNQNQPWCVIFLHWVFRTSGGKDPLADVDVVGDAVAPISKAVGKRKTGDIVTKPGGGVKRGHIGICVDDYGTCVAGNSGDMVQHEGGWLESFRPKYSPDIIGIRVGKNGKTFYYNPETKKLCTDKEGKNPIQGNVNAITGGPSKSGGSSSGGSSGGSSPSSESTEPVPYIEHYYIKPKDFKDAKDIVNTDGGPTEFHITQRLLVLKADWQSVINMYPKEKSTNFNNYYDVSYITLLKEYKKMIKIMTNSLTPFNFVENQSCYRITGGKSKDTLRRCEGIDYIKSEHSNFYNYYNFISSEWIDLFNDLTSKRDALLLYKEANEKYIDIFRTNAYYDKFYADIANFHDEKLVEFNRLKKSYMREYSAQYPSLSKQLEDSIKNTESLKVSINALQQRQNKIFPKIQQFNKKIKEYQELYDNLYDNKENIKQNFSDLYAFWNQNIIKNPNHLDFWLEFLDTSGELQNHSIKNIGDLTFTESNSSIRAVYQKNIPNIIYYTEKPQSNQTNYNYFKLNFDLSKFFINSSRGISAKEEIDELLYNYSYCSKEISLNTIPIYYLEPNTKIFIYDEKSHINNECVINKISNQLTINGTMNISANKINKRII